MINFITSGCPIRFGAPVIGDRWCLMIIRDLMLKNRKYFIEFLEAGEGISTNILADRLLRLEDLDIIRKTQDPNHGKRFVYQLTPKGLDLAPVMLELIKWAANYDTRTEMLKPFIKTLRSNPEVIRKSIVSNLSSK